MRHRSPVVRKITQAHVRYNVLVSLLVGGVGRHWPSPQFHLLRSIRNLLLLVSPVFPTITLNDHPLEVVHQIKYSGITFSQNLCWLPHIQPICKKARRIATWHTLPTVLFYRHSLFICPKVVYILLLLDLILNTLLKSGIHIFQRISSLERVQKFRFFVVCTTTVLGFNNLVLCTTTVLGFNS